MQAAHLPRRIFSAARPRRYRQATTFFSKQFKPIPPAPTEFVTEEQLNKYVADAARVLNATLHSAYALMVCECTPVALWWMGGLAAVYWFSSRLGTTAFLALCWVCAFTLPVGYSKKQAEVDGLVATAKSKASEVWETAKSKIPTKGEKAPEEKKAD